MEDKASKRALERFPVHEGASKEWIESYLKDICGDYIEGYHQAEEDLELTWEDIRLIDSIGSQFSFETGEWPYRKEHYEEILKRFREMKEK